MDFNSFSKHPFLLDKIIKQRLPVSKKYSLSEENVENDSQELKSPIYIPWRRHQLGHLLETSNNVEMSLEGSEEE